MLGSYTRGTDMPPIMRDALLGNNNAVRGFNALSDSGQRALCERCSRMSTVDQIDDLIRETDCFISDDVICSGFSSADTRFL